MRKQEVDFELAMMGFAKSDGRDFLSAACLLYAGGMHRMQDITAKISEVTGIRAGTVYNRMVISLRNAWKNAPKSPEEMFDLSISRRCPTLKKFIKTFVDQRMGEKV